MVSWDFFLDSIAAPISHSLLQTQGSTHLDRGMNYVMLLESMVEGMPLTHTIDWIEGAGHDFEAMMDNDAAATRVSKLCYHKLHTVD
jgi:hypothetical protein